MADSLASLADLIGGGDKQSALLRLQREQIMTPSPQETRADVLSSFAKGMNNGSTGGSLLGGVLEGVAGAQKVKAADKRQAKLDAYNQRIEQAMAYQQYLGQIKDMAVTKNMAEQESVQFGPQLAVGLEKWNNSGDLTELVNTTKAMKGSQEYMRMGAEAPQGSRFDRYQEVRDGTTKAVQPIFITPDGQEVSGPKMPYEALLNQFAKPYADQKAVKELESLGAQADLAKKQADVQATQALAEQRRSKTGGVTMQTITDADGNEVRVAVPNTPAKPMPASAVKLQNDTMEELAIANNTQSDLKAFEDQITNGTLNLSLVGNLWNKGKNMVGLSDADSRNLQSFQASLEKLRNDSLRLNKGVQTEGDAQRAWNELLANINDEGVVKQRLQEIQTINARAADLKKLQIETLRGNYGQPAMDYSRLKGSAAVGQAKGGDSNLEVQSSSSPNGLPQGAKQVGTSGGKAVYQTPDGKMFVEE